MFRTPLYEVSSHVPLLTLRTPSSSQGQIEILKSIEYGDTGNHRVQPSAFLKSPSINLRYDLLKSDSSVALLDSITCSDSAPGTTFNLSERHAKFPCGTLPVHAQFTSIPGIILVLARFEVQLQSVSDNVRDGRQIDRTVFPL